MAYKTLANFTYYQPLLSSAIASQIVPISYKFVILGKGSARPSFVSFRSRKHLNSKTLLYLTIAK